MKEKVKELQAHLKTLKKFNISPPEDPKPMDIDVYLNEVRKIIARKVSNI